MKRWRNKTLLAGLLFGVAFQPASLWACAACYGASDSPMAKGMNMGIFTLLGVIVMVLGGIATFFVYLAKKSAALAAETAAGVVTTGINAKGLTCTTFSHH